MWLYLYVWFCVVVAVGVMLWGAMAGPGLWDDDEDDRD